MIKLKKHQEIAMTEVIGRLNKHGVVILEGQQRTGKTLVALSVAQTHHKPVLFLTKKKAMGSVKADAEACGASVCIINYESVHKLEPMDWGLVICDECHSSGLSSYPKPSGVWRKVRAIFDRTGAKALLMSGTIAIESKAQLYHELGVTGMGPWQMHKSFFYWWNPEHHYKKSVVAGGYGRYGAVKRIGGGNEVADYAKVDGDRIDRDISELLVCVSREDAGFKVTEASQKVVKATNGAILGLCDKIMKDGLVVVGTHYCVYETPAAKLQGAHMACGGTLLDENGDVVVLEEYGATYKLDLIRERAKEGLKYVIFSHYIGERSFLLSELGEDGTSSLDVLRAGVAQFCVLSTTSYSMGVDLSWISGCCIMYSMPWSGSVWSQVLDRQLKFDREREAVVGIVLLDGGIDEVVYDAVSKKQNFNLTRYRQDARKPNPKTHH